MPKLKQDEQGHVVVAENGYPVWIDDDGKEIAYDVPKMINDLQKSNAENAGRRKENEALNEKLKVFDGIDPDKARKAFETLKNLDDKKLVDAGEVEQIKQAAVKAYEDKLANTTKTYEEQLAEVKKDLQVKDGSIRNLLIKGAFDSSKFIKEKTLLLPDIAFSHFGKNFEIEDVDGQPQAVGRLNGEKIFSRKNPGQLASPEEVIEILFDNHPQKNDLLKGSDATGGGSGGSQQLGNSHYVLTEEQAKDPRIYRRAKAAAAEAGQEIIIQ